MLTDRPPKFVGAMAAYDYDAGLHRLCCFQSRFGDAVDMSYREGATLYVPRAGVPLPVNPAFDYRRTSDTIAINCNFVPRHAEQAALPGESLKLLQAGQNHVFEAPTGWGKSIAGGVIACGLGQTTAIVVNKTDLMDGWYDAIVRVLGVPPSLVGRVQQDTCDWQGKRIVLMMAQSICIPDRYPPEMYRYFGLLIVDEVHQMPTEFFSAVFRLFAAYYRLGFSATADRRDGKWRVVQAHVGPTLVRGSLVPMVPRILVRHTGWRIPVYRQRQDDGRYREVKIPYAPGRMALVFKAMIASQPRNWEIVQFTKAAYEKDRITLILSDTRAHLDRLFQLLASSGIPGNHIGYYVGGMTKQQIEVTKTTARAVLATYKMCGTGTNCPVWDSLVFGTPRADIRQSLGRVLRSMNGKRQPVALDLVDHDRIFSAFHMDRLTQYHALKADIVRMV